MSARTSRPTRHAPAGPPDPHGGRLPPRNPAGAPRVDLWLSDLDDPSGCDASAALLSADERARADRFRHERDRRRFRRGRGRLRSTLAAYLSLPGERIRFRRTAAGRPELEAGGGLGFSVSHAEHLLLIGVAAGPVGVDVEIVRPLPDLDAVAALAFTERELDSLHDGAPGGTAQRFFRLWTAKEAVLKGIGRGFSSDPRALELRPTPGGFHARPDGDAGAAWAVVSFRVAASVAGSSAWGAVAVPGPPPGIRAFAHGADAAREPAA